MIASNCERSAVASALSSSSVTSYPELRDALRHLIADAHHVADLQAGHDADVDAAHGDGRGTIEVASLEIAEVDLFEALGVLAPIRGRDRRDLVQPVLDGPGW